MADPTQANMSEDGGKPLPVPDRDQRFELLQALVRNSSDIITVIGPDGTVRYSSPAATRVLGYPEGYSMGAFEFVHPDDMERVLEAFASALHGAGEAEAVEFRVRHHDGSWRTVESRASNLLSDPSVDGIVVNTRDITDRCGAEAALRESEERYRLLVERSPEAILVQHHGHIVYINAAGARLLGATQAAELIGIEVLEIIHPEDREAVITRMNLLESGHEVELREERFVRLDGQTIEVEVMAVPMTYEGAKAALVMARDISDRKRAERDLAHQALHDGLTGLPNRTLFLDRLSHALARMARSGDMLAVLFLDLDRFKVINDSLGHDVGDRLLITVSQRLSEALRPADTVARFGGDEFVVLCEALSDITEVAHVAQRLADALRAPLHDQGEELRVDASIGIAIATSDLSTPDELIRDADAAMYRAKERGRGRFEIFDEAMRTRAMGRLQQENGLRRALERDELRVFYQPVLALSDDSIVGVEALVRWQHPEHGLLEPAGFIGAAEESGLIVPLGAWVLQEACRQARVWNAERPPGKHIEVAVNLSARQLFQRDLVEVVSALFEAVEVNPGVVNLCLEITERVLMDDAVVALRTLERLKALGVRLAIDDFGTGYSSLAYLSRFPVDVLKVDRAFVSGLCVQPEDRTIVASIIELAHALGMVVVAEGVETREQLNALRELDCDMAQGYLFARPQPADALSQLLRQASFAQD